jgi:hypothetical protein
MSRDRLAPRGSQQSEAGSVIVDSFHTTIESTPWESSVERGTLGLFHLLVQSVCRTQGLAFVITTPAGDVDSLYVGSANSANGELTQ